MKLTKKTAIAICKELWTFLKETGLKKEDWDGWGKYGNIEDGCPFCEYSLGDCRRCPYYQKFGHCGDHDAPYCKWCFVETLEERKKYAGEFLTQLELL